MKKKEKTGQLKLAFELNEQVRIHNAQSKEWDVKGVVTDIRTSEEGTILSHKIVCQRVILLHDIDVS